MPYPEPTLFAVPLFVAALVWERKILARRIAAGEGAYRGYERRDTWASLALGLGSLVTVGLLNLAVFGLATWLWRGRIVDLGTSWLGWSVAIVGWDFAYYWLHRSEHTVRLLWAAHENHHSSRRYNLSTALRQPWTPIGVLIAFPPLALLGVRPWMVMVAGGINLIYQFWIHTEAIDRMPRWFEAVFNTPSHHRVHHGRNRRYLDRNHGGVLIVWDRLFGTFEPEGERVEYGLTKAFDSYHPLVIAFHEYVDLWHDVRRAPRWRDRFAHLVRGPGWQPTASVR